MNHKEKLQLIEEDSAISLSRQAQLLGISRSSLYYQPKINKEDFRIMNAIDEIFTRCPFYGHRRIREDLKDYQIFIGRKRTLSLMKKLGLNAIYPKKKTSIPNKEHEKYPYLLRNLLIKNPNQVWGVDITYIRLRKHFVYLVAILDWFSRFVLSWKLSPTLEEDFCIQALEEALMRGKPLIHNSDQGCQFTAKAYLKVLKENKVRISMDGRGRCMDNIFTERLWRTVKYENVFLSDYSDFKQAYQGLSRYFEFYNQRRKHQSLNYKTPAQVYFNN